MNTLASALAACLLAASPAPATAPPAAPAAPSEKAKGPPDPPSLSAQPGAGPPTALETVVEAAYAGMVGEWAEYAVLVGGKPVFTDTIRFSILADDNPALPPWIEIWMDKLGRTATRLRRGEKVGGQMFFKMGSVIYSVDSFAAFVPKDGDCATGECKGPPKNQRPWTPVSLTTAAGAYKCRYAKLPSKQGAIEVWYADDIPATHLAKIRLADGTGYEVVASGKGAISSFPRKFNAVTLPLESPKIVEALAPKMPPPARAAADAGTAAPDAGTPRPLQQWGAADAGR